MKEKVIFIRESKWKIVKKFLFLWLIASPVLIMVFGEEKRPENVPPKEENMQKVFLVIYLLYCGIVLFLMIIRLIKANTESIIKLDEEGITVKNTSFFPWNEIYDFRIGVKLLSYDVLNKNGGISGAKEYEEKKILTINDEEFHINEKYLDYSLPEIGDIIRIYKERLQSPKLI